MSLLVIDGFDHSDGAAVWTSFGATVVTDIVRTGPRAGFFPGGTSFRRSLTGGEEDDGVTFGAAFWIHTDNAIFDNGPGFTAREDSLGTIHIHAKFRNGTRSIQLRRGATVIAETDANIWTFNTWHYLELKVKIADAGGTAEVRLNGVTVISFTGDTRNGGTDGRVEDAVFEGGNAGSAQGIWCDDVYLLNEQGPAPHNTFLGDTRCWPLYPNGNGNYSQFVGSDGNSTDNYLLVDEAGAPSSADYVASAVDGNKDTYTFQDLTPTTGTIFGVEIRMYAAKEDSGARSMRSLVRRAGTDVAGDDQPLAAGSYFTFRQLYELDPVAAAAWTITNVNGSEFGVEARP